MGRLADATLGDVVRGLARYRPVALTVAAVVGLALFLPGGLREADGPGHAGELALGLDPLGDDEGRGGPRGEGGSRDRTSGGAEADADGGDDVTTSLAVPPPSASFRRPATTTPPARAGRSFTPTVASTTTTTRPALAAPLRLRATGWATARAGTPLGTSGVPEGALPVANRFGDVDKASFVRLSGTASELVLAERAEGSRDAVAGDAAVQACRVTEPGWAPAEGESLEEAPAWDPTACVAGERGDDGTWVFDLSGFTDVTDERGFALVPGDGAAVDFQVAFADQAVG